MSKIVDKVLAANQSCAQSFEKKAESRFPLVNSHKLRVTNERFVIYPTNCGMELFSDEINVDVLEDSRRPHSPERIGRIHTTRRPCGEPFQQMAHN